MSLTIEQVRVYIKAVDSGRIEKRPLDGMQGLARLAIAQDEENRQLREALEWYADPFNWAVSMPNSWGQPESDPAWMEKGERARTALAAAEAEA